MDGVERGEIEDDEFGCSGGGLRAGCIGGELAESGFALPAWEGVWSRVQWEVMELS
jgi:hypothetical protein